MPKPKSALPILFVLDDKTAELLVKKCFHPSIIERAFNLRQCDGAEGRWCYKLANGDGGVVAKLPREFKNNTSEVADAIKSMAMALGITPMYMLVTLVSGAACINTQQKLAS